MAEYGSYQPKSIDEIIREQQERRRREEREIRKQPGRSSEERCRAFPDDCATLRKLVPRGATVYYQQFAISSSGMSRSLRFFVPYQNQIVDITGYMRRLLGSRRSRSKEYPYAISVGGTGANHGAMEVMFLSRTLYGDDYGLNAKSL